MIVDLWNRGSGDGLDSIESQWNTDLTTQRISHWPLVSEDIPGVNKRTGKVGRRKELSQNTHEHRYGHRVATGPTEDPVGKPVTDLSTTDALQSTCLSSSKPPLST